MHQEFTAFVLAYRSLISMHAIEGHHRNAHNERFKADKEKEQQKKEKLHEDMLKGYEKYHARLAAMMPEEREAWERQWEKDRTRKRLTPDELTQLLYEMHANVQAMRRKRAAWLH